MFFLHHFGRPSLVDLAVLFADHSSVTSFQFVRLVDPIPMGAGSGSMALESVQEKLATPKPSPEPVPMSR